jgi:hypothetical protein
MQLITHLSSWYKESNITSTEYANLTTVIIKEVYFSDITTCSTMNDDRRFGRTYHIHSQKVKKKTIIKQLCYLLHVNLFPVQFFGTENRDMFY